jgi:hypothetical protein
VAVMVVLGGIGLYVLDKVKKQRYKESTIHPQNTLLKIYN